MKTPEYTEFELEDRIVKKIYGALKPIWEQLDHDFRQLAEFKKAEQAHKTYRDNMTAERYKALTERPHQSECDHLKGGSRIPLFGRSPSIDYAILTHTFSDAHIEVKCMICGKQFDPKDPKTLEMIQKSTNSPSTSEISPKRL